MQPQAMPVSDLSLAKGNTEIIFVSADLELQMQPQEMPVSYLFLAKVNTENIFVSTDLDPDLDPVQAIARVFSETYSHDPHTPHLLTQMRFFTPLSCDIETERTKPTSRKIVVSSDLGPDPSAGFDSKGLIARGNLGPSKHQRDQTMLRNYKLQIQPQAVPVSHFSILNKPTSRKTVASSDMDPDPSSGLDSGGVINQGFLEQLLLNSSCHDFEKVEKGRKLSSQLWYAGQKRVLLRMTGKFMTTSFFAYNLNNQLWLCMAGKFMTKYLCVYYLSNQLWLRIPGYLNYLSSTYVFISSFVSLTKYAGRKLKIVMWLRMAGKFMSTYFFAYGYLANVSSIDCR